MGLDTGHRAVRRHHEVTHRLHRRDGRRESRQHLRHERIQPLRGVDHGAKVVGHFVDAIKCVEDRLDGPADRDVEAVRLPVEVVAQGPEEVVEVRDVISELVGVGLDLLRGANQVVCGAGDLLQNAVHVFHVGDGLGQLVGLLKHLSRVVVLNLGRLECGGVLHGDLEWDGTVFDRRPQGPGDGLHSLDTAQVEDALGDPVDDEHVRRVAQIVVGFDHEQFGVHPCLAEMPVGRRIRDVRGHVGRGVLLIVVLRYIRQQADEADDRDCTGHDDDGLWPAHHDGADFAPATR